MTQSTVLTRAQQDSKLVEAILNQMPRGLAIPFGVAPAVLANKMAKAAFRAGVSADDAMFNITGALLLSGEALHDALLVGKFGLLSVYPIEYIEDIKFMTGWSAQDIAELQLSGDINLTPDGYYCGAEVIAFAAKCSKYSPRADFSPQEKLSTYVEKSKMSKPQANTATRKPRTKKVKTLA